MFFSTNFGLRVPVHDAKSRANGCWRSWDHCQWFALLPGWFRCICIHIRSGGCSYVTSLTLKLVKFILKLWSLEILQVICHTHVLTISILHFQFKKQKTATNKGSHQNQNLPGVFPFFFGSRGGSEAWLAARTYPMDPPRVELPLQKWKQSQVWEQ